MQFSSALKRLLSSDVSGESFSDLVPGGGTGTDNLGIFGLNYSDSEQRTIDQFKIEESSTFDHFGTLSTLRSGDPSEETDTPSKDPKSLLTFLSGVGPNRTSELHQMEALILNMVSEVLTAYRMAHFWISVRVSLPNNLYDKPRWHKDGNFFLQETQQSKFVTTIRGPGTLLIASTPKSNLIYDELHENEMSEILNEKSKEAKHRIMAKHRTIIEKHFADQPVHRLLNTEGCVLRVGVPFDRATLHSEPPTDCCRIFVSILPGSEQNIDELRGRFWNR